MPIGKWRLARFDPEVPLRYPLLNPLGGGESRTLRSLVSLRSPRSLRLGLPLVATIGFETGILDRKPQDLKGAF
jgi:hypothetical protein